MAALRANGRLNIHDKVSVHACHVWSPAVSAGFQCSLQPIIGFGHRGQSERALAHRKADLILLSSPKINLPDIKFFLLTDSCVLEFLADHLILFTLDT